MLIISQLFFNGSSTLNLFGDDNFTPNSPKIITCTLLSATTGGLASSFIKPIINGTYSRNHRYDIGALTNGMLAGAVAVSGVCDRCQPWCAFLIGILSSIVYSLACKLWDKMGVDDPLEAS